MPLADYRVVDLSQGIAGPSCAKYCADWGCDVIKVEPLSGDWIRELGTRAGEFTASALAYNGGKRSIAIDLKSERAPAVMEALFASADVVIESFRPGVADRLGVGYDAARSASPGVTYLSINGFGPTGPLADVPCTDTVVQAFSGFMSLNRGRDGVPHKVDTTIIDAITGLYAFQTLSMNLLTPNPMRDAGFDQEFASRHLNVSLMEAAASILSQNIIEWNLADGDPSALNAPAGTYQSADGWIAITLVRDHQFVALAEAIGKPALAADDRFRNFELRAQNLDALRALIDSVIAVRPTDYWLKVFADQGVLASRIQTIGEWLEHPQVQTQNVVSTNLTVEGDNRTHQVPLPRMPGTDAAHNEQPAPKIGEHTRAILDEIGFSKKAINDLLKSDCIA